MKELIEKIEGTYNSELKLLHSHPFSFMRNCILHNILCVVVCLFPLLPLLFIGEVFLKFVQPRAKHDCRA